jgi:ABC-type multidrug transport system ATPase subunit
MQPHILNLKNVSFSYLGKELALQAIDLSLRHGEPLALLGHNGAGKTTLLRLMAGILAPTGGEMETSPTTRRGTSFLPEGLGIYPRLSVEENLRIRLIKAKQDSSSGSIDSWLQKGDLLEHRKKPAGQLSTGLKRRLGLIGSLSELPLLLLLDEPFSGVDPVSRKIMASLILKSSQEDQSIVIASHDLDLVAEVCDWAVIIKDGIIVKKISIDKQIKGYSKKLEKEYFSFAGA